MKYESAGAFRAALDDRLRLTAASAHGPSLMRLRKMVVFDRLLARLLAVAPGQWIIKGGVALDFRLGGRARTTKDLDLARRDNLEAAASSMIDASRMPLDDLFDFSIERINVIDHGLAHPTVRYRATANLGGRLFDTISMDIGFDDLWPVEPDVLAGPDLLTFAGLPILSVPALPLEMHLVEKVHAYTRIYQGGRASSRVKDLVDIVLISTSAEFTSDRLRLTILKTFDHRRTHRLPDTLPDPPADWRLPYRRLARELNLDPDMTAARQLVASFLGPILTGTLPEAAIWNPLGSYWHTETDS